MRNIVVLQESHDSIAYSTSSPFTHFSYDYSTKHLYACTATNILVQYDASTKHVVHELSLVEAGVLSAESKVVAVQCIHNMGMVCVVSDTGDIIVYETDSKQLECVGIMDSGITTMAWSPDFEVVVLGTKKGTLIAMTKDWEVLTEIQPTHTVSSVTWRGDGAFFASCGKTSEGVAELIVWERNCALHSRATLGSGEQMNVGAGMISWRPAGQVIASLSPPASSPSPAPASPTSTPVSQRVIFFERNGLRHGEFALRGTVPHGRVAQLGWSCDSETLAALVDGTIQLWNSSNYHWSLKREVLYAEKARGDLLGFEWDPEDPHCIRAVSQGGIFTEIKFVYEYNVSDVPCMPNRYLAGVVDGDEIRFTPFRQVVVPPPMCSFSSKFSSPVLSFTYGNPEKENDPEVIVLTADNTISLLAKKNPASPLSPLQVISSHKSSVTLSYLRQPVWISPTLFAIQTENRKDYIVHITFTPDLQKIDSITSHHAGPLSNQSPILRIARGTTANLLVEHFDGSTHFHSVADSSSSSSSASSQITSFPLPCIQIASLPLPSPSTPTAVGLTATGKLYIGSTLLSPICNSFFIQGTFLLFTTTNHKLHFLPLTSINPSSPSPPATESCEIERGGILVAAVALDVRVILQMPRGNLETIHPHIVCLSLARTLLDREPPNYRDAFLLLRKYRLDLNLLYDYNPSNFLSQVDAFVPQLGTVDYLNLFISALNKEVKSFFPDVVHAQETTDEPKINAVCNALRRALIASDESKYLLPILTTYVKKDPPELGETLQLIQKLRDSAQPSSTTASKALDYVVFLVDVDHLYDVALGLYDFDLVLMVAQKSQKDPKEYLPFIANLQAMDTHTQRYTIDAHLGRWDSALQNLAASGEDKLEQVIALMTKHSLFQTALRIYKNNANALRLVYSTYGDHLSGIGKSEAAGYAYLSGGKAEKALSSFKECSKWREAIHAARITGMDADSLRGLAYELAENLKSLSLHADAGTLLVEHAGDPEAAIVSFVEGRVWDDAHRLAQLHNRMDLVETHLLPALHDEAAAVLEDATHHRESFATKVERLKAIRKNKHLLAQHVGDDENKEEDQSEAGSMASGFSRNSAWSDRSGFSTSSAGSGMSYASTSSSGSVVSWQSLTSKGMLSKRSGRKKKEHKSRVTGKEGSRHEEEYLVDYLRGMIPSARRQTDVGRLIRALVRAGFAQKAQEVQEAFRAFITVIDASLDTLNASAIAVGQEKAKAQEKKSAAHPNANNKPADSQQDPPKTKEITREHTTWMLGLWP